MKVPFAFLPLLSLASISCAAHAPMPTTTTSASIDRAPGRVYRLDFTLTTKPANGAPQSHAYAMNLEEGQGGSLRAGDNVTVGGSTERTDTGFALSSRFDMAGEDLIVHADLGLSTLAGSTIHKVSTNGMAVVSPGKPALVASVEDEETRDRYDLSVAVTRVH